jgi:DNA-binding transcriptional MerR regulator
MDESLILTTSQVIALVGELDREKLKPRTLAVWAQTGIVVPSVAWQRRRGRYNPRVYNLTDLARVRLVVRLRKAGVSMPRVRAVLAYLDRELREVLRPKTQAVLIVEGWRGAIVHRPGRPDMEVPSGQLRLPLMDVVEGNREAAKVLLKAA